MRNRLDYSVLKFLGIPICILVTCIRTLLEHLTSMPIHKHGLTPRSSAMYFFAASSFFRNWRNLRQFLPFALRQLDPLRDVLLALELCQFGAVEVLGAEVGDGVGAAHSRNPIAAARASMVATSATMRRPESIISAAVRSFRSATWAAGRATRRWSRSKQ